VRAPLVAYLPVTKELDHHIVLLLLACTALIWIISFYSSRKQRDRLLAIGCALLATEIPLKPLQPSATLLPGLALATVGALIGLRLLADPIPWRRRMRRFLLALASQIVLRHLVEFGLWISLAALLNHCQLSCVLAACPDRPA
jgi:hypothetical protein